MTEESPKLPWPQKGDVLFKADDDWWHNACLNWAFDQMDLYTMGYYTAAETLVEKAQATRHSLDLQIFPIVFLYRQYIELRLKELIKVGSWLYHESNGPITGHDIMQLWKRARKYIERVWPDGSKEDLECAEDYIKQFVQIDPASTAFRYPTDKKGKPSVPGIRHINIRNFSEIMKKLSSLLEGSSTGMNEYWDNIPREYGDM